MEGGPDLLQVSSGFSSRRRVVSRAGRRSFLPSRPASRRVVNPSGAAAGVRGPAVRGVGPSWPSFRRAVGFPGVVAAGVPRAGAVAGADAGKTEKK